VCQSCSSYLLCGSGVSPVLAAAARGPPTMVSYAVVPREGALSRVVCRGSAVQCLFVGAMSHVP